MGLAWALALHGSTLNPVPSLCGRVDPAAHSSLSFSFHICQFYCLELHSRPQNQVGVAIAPICIITLTFSVSVCDVATIRPNEPHCWGISKAGTLLGVHTTLAAVLLPLSLSLKRGQPLGSHHNLYSGPGLLQVLYITNFT